MKPARGATALTIAVLAAPVVAQEVLNDRVALRGDLPIVSVGLDDGANGFRTRTPLLEQSDKQATIVDRDELARRTLAMYETGRAPVAVTPMPDGDDPRSPQQAAPAPETTSGAPSAWVFVLAAAIVAVVAFALARNRRAS